MIGLALSSCASTSVPDTFVYQTSVRDEQGWQGASARLKSAETLLSAGVIIDPEAALQRAVPDGEVKVRKWGARYFSKDWKRYQVLLNADIRRDDTVTKCRLRAPLTPVGAPTLQTLTANDGIELQRQLEELVAVCLGQSNDLT